MKLLKVMMHLFDLHIYKYLSINSLQTDIQTLRINGALVLPAIKIAYIKQFGLFFRKAPAQVFI